MSSPFNPHTGRYVPAHVRGARPAQEAIALTVFRVVMVVGLGEPMTWRYLAAVGRDIAAVASCSSAGAPPEGKIFTFVCICDERLERKASPTN